jgi:NAD(P)-dependent dehydrogenase (short-subunit alcohol dehydrogenase family)
MADELAGKVAIVTGGSSGIGRGTAQRFLAEGARVVIADIDQAPGEAFAAGFGRNAVFKKTDVADQEQVRELVAFAVETFGGLHVMFNNAGISGARHPRLLDESFDDFQRVMAINLLGVMVGTREAGRHMAQNGGGAIINISSIGGVQPAPGNWAYHVSKSSVVFFTRCAAIDLGEYGVRVNCIAPGNIETPILASNILAGIPEHERAQLTKTIREFIMSRQPLRRQGTTDDIAEAALYLSTDRSRYVTGTLLPVDGGMVAGANPATSRGLADAIKEARGG